MAGGVGIPIGIADRTHSDRADPLPVPDQTADVGRFLVCARSPARDPADGVGVLDVAAGGEIPNQSADVLVARHAAGGIGVADVAAGAAHPNQPANIACARDIAGGIGVADVASFPNQPADVIHARYAGVGIGVFDADVAASDQPADVIRARDAARDLGVSDASVPLLSDQPADVGTSQDVDVHQPYMADLAAGDVAKQSHIVLSDTVDGEVAEGVTKAIEFSGEGAGLITVGISSVIPHRLPIGDAAQIDIATHGIGAGWIVPHGLQRSGIVDHGVGDEATITAIVQAEFGTEVLPALQVDGGIDEVIRAADEAIFIAVALAVVQRQLAVRVLGGDAGVDVDAVVGAQGQGGVLAPDHLGVDVDIALVRAVVGDRRLQGDIGVVQVGAEDIGADAAVALRRLARADGEVGWVDQPFAGLAVRRQGGHPGAVLNLHMGAAGVDKAAVAAIGRAGVKGAGHLHGAAGEVAEQDDLAVLLTQGARFDHASVVDHRLEQRLSGMGGEQHLAAVGADQLMVFRQGIGHGFVDLHMEQAVAGEIQGHRIARRQDHAALVGDDGALIADGAAEQGDAATVRRGDLAVVDHAGIAAVTLEGVAAGFEVAVADIQGGGHQAADVDLGTPAEQHAVGVDQEHPTVGIELAHDLRAIGAEHAVQRNRVAAGLVEGHLVTGSDIETLPVDGEFIAGLVDHHLMVRWRADLPLSRDHLATGGQVGGARHGRQQQSGCQYGACALAPTAGMFIGDAPGAEAWVPDEGIGAVHGVLPLTFKTDQFCRCAG